MPQNTARFAVRVIALIVLAVAATQPIAANAQSLAVRGLHRAQVGGGYADFTSDARGRDGQFTHEHIRLRIVDRLQFIERLEVADEGYSADVRVQVNAGIFNNKWHAATHLVEGRVIAGVPTSELRPTQITFDPILRTYTIVLPAAEILDVYLSNVDQDEASRSASLHNIDWSKLRPLARQQGVEMLVEKAKDSGILRRAEYQAADLIESMIAAITADRAQVAFLRDSRDPKVYGDRYAGPPTEFRRVGNDSWAWS